MKKIYKPIICLALLASMASCSDFLDEEPKSEMSTEQYFASPEHAKAAVNRLYRSGVPSFYDSGSAYAGPNIMLGGYLSGLFDNEYKGQEVVVQYSQNLTLTPANVADSMDEIWDNCYVAISRANTAINNIDRTPGLTDTEKKGLLSEAKFFRAYNYFHLVKFFGDVPLLLNPFESLEGLYVKRTASNLVYDQIVKDLTEAIPNLNNAAFTDNHFRITKPAAETLLADVYLNMSGFPLNTNRYKEAATAALSVINGGKHALMTNGATPEESAYNQIRTLDNSKEYIYSKEYQLGIAENGYRPAYAFPSNAASWGIFKYAITNNIYRPTSTIINAYDPVNDLRVKEKQFFFSTYTYTKNGAQVTATFDPSPWMFYDEKALLEDGKSGKDIAVYRYSEVLLIAAEAIAQTDGVTAQAVGYLADVRARAYTTMTRQEIVTSLTGLSKENFINEVWKERLREFPLENKVWNDIQRTRMYPVTSSTNKGEITFVNVIGAKNPWGATFAEKHLLWPISANERQRNPELTQNLGY